MSVLRTANYNDQNTNKLQSLILKEIDDISNIIKTISSDIQKTKSDILQFDFSNSETPQNQEYINRLKSFGTNLEGVTGFPPIQDIELGQYEFEAVDPIKVIFDRNIDIGQTVSREFNLKFFYENLNAQYNSVFATLEDLTNLINALMDQIQNQHIDRLEDLHLSLAEDLNLNFYLWEQLFRIVLNNLSTLNILNLRTYFKNTDQRDLPAGFNFINENAFTAANDVSSNLPVFTQKAVNTYMETIFNNVEVEPIDLSAFQVPNVNAEEEDNEAS